MIVIFGASNEVGLLAKTDDVAKTTKIKNPEINNFFLNDFSAMNFLLNSYIISIFLLFKKTKNDKKMGITNKIYFCKKSQNKSPHLLLVKGVGIN